MMNGIWLGLMVAAVLAGAFGGTMGAVSAASVESAKTAVNLALGLVGLMAFWLGLMRVLQEAGLLAVLARRLRPILGRLFPDVPADHPAMEAMILNIASNMLGLGNAATPFGIKAMIELDRLNRHHGVATDSMVLFLAINTSGLALAPLGVISLRAAVGSADPAGIWLPTLLATSFSTVVGILAAKGLARVVRPASAYADVAVGDVAAAIDLPNARELLVENPTSRSGCALALAVGAALLVGLLWTMQGAMADGATALGFLREEVLRNWLLPLLIVSMLLYGRAKGVAVYDVAVEGAKEGFEVAVRIIPFLVAILVSVGMLRASGLLQLTINALAPLTDPLGLPAAALPMALLRPLSGGGAYGVLAETLESAGADSHVGYLVSVLNGSTETTFYVLAVYFGAVGVTRIRHALAAGLLADLAGVVGAVVAVSWLLV